MGIHSWRARTTSLRDQMLESTVAVRELLQRSVWQLSRTARLSRTGLRHHRHVKPASASAASPAAWPLGKDQRETESVVPSLPDLVSQEERQRGSGCCSSHEP